MVSVLEDENDYTNLIQNNNILVAYFTAPWCQPCNAVSPMIDTLAMGYNGDVEFIKINLDEFGDVALDNNVEKIPTFLVYHKTKLVYRTTGVDVTKLIETIQELILDL
jgi:thioredoxin-like negative regulator of GroEL